MSTSLYDTFGNEINVRVTQETLDQYLKDATIKFVLPEATSQLLFDFVQPDSIDASLYEVVKTKLENLGFREANAKAMSSVLLKIAKDKGISPLVYFEDSDTALKLATDTYSALNLIRPSGNRIGLKLKVNNAKSRASGLIKP